jgi:hypothetical protein
MGEFFRGWRRNLGVVTLMMTLILMGGWVRSHIYIECVILRFGDAIIFNFDSDPHGIGVVWRSLKKDNTWPISAVWTQQLTKDSPNYDSPLAKNSPSHKWHFCGVHLGRGKIYFWQNDFAVCRCSYWHVIVPLTLLSAILILTRPCPPDLKQSNSEPRGHSIKLTKSEFRTSNNSAELNHIGPLAPSVGSDRRVERQ